MKKQNFKSFSLFSMWSGRYLLQIQAVITRLGGFKNKSKIILRHRKNDISYRDNKARCLAKKRDLGYHRISFYHKGCEMHHVNKEDVVAISAYIHHYFPHNIRGYSSFRLEGVLG